MHYLQQLSQIFRVLNTDITYWNKILELKKKCRLQTSLNLPTLEWQSTMKAHIGDLRPQSTSRKCPGLSSQCPVLFISLPIPAVPKARELLKK